MTSKLEEAARAHASIVYELYADPHSADSESTGFIAGAKWLLEEARKRRTLNFHIITQEDAEIVAIKDLEELVGDK